MAVQTIMIKIDTQKVTEYGAMILHVIPPRENLPQGTVLIHETLSLPGFKMKVTEEAPTITVGSSFDLGEFIQPIPKQPESTPTVPDTDVTPTTEKIVKGFFGNKKKNKNKK